MLCQGRCLQARLRAAAAGWPPPLMSPDDGLPAVVSSFTSLQRPPHAHGHRRPWSSTGRNSRCPKIGPVGRGAQRSKGGGTGAARSGGRERSSAPRRSDLAPMPARKTNDRSGPRGDAWSSSTIDAAQHPRPTKRERDRKLRATEPALPGRWRTARRAKPLASRGAPASLGASLQAAPPSGKRTVNSAPGGDAGRPGRGGCASATETSASCALAISCTIARPRPLPSTSVPWPR